MFPHFNSVCTSVCGSVIVVLFFCIFYPVFLCFIHRATDDQVLYAPACVPVTQEALDSAVEWLWKWERTEPVSRTATAEAILKALSDHQVMVIL